LTGPGKTTQNEQRTKHFGAEDCRGCEEEFCGAGEGQVPKFDKTNKNGRKALCRRKKDTPDRKVGG